MVCRKDFSLDLVVFPVLCCSFRYVLRNSFGYNTHNGSWVWSRIRSSGTFLLNTAMVFIFVCYCDILFCMQSAKQEMYFTTIKKKFSGPLSHSPWIFGYPCNDNNKKNQRYFNERNKECPDIWLYPFLFIITTFGWLKKEWKTDLGVTHCEDCRCKQR